MEMVFMVIVECDICGSENSFNVATCSEIERCWRCGDSIETGISDTED